MGDCVFDKDDDGRLCLSALDRNGVRVAYFLSCASSSSSKKHQRHGKQKQSIPTGYSPLFFFWSPFVSSVTCHGMGRG